jgi:hypothetical protein
MPLKHDGDLITLSKWTKNYRQSVPPGSTLGYFFGRSVIEAILEQPDCTGIRIYKGVDAEGVSQLIITGVDEEGNDIYQGVLAERPSRNPPYYVAPNPLNS